jgi:hypothetical protein
MSRGLIASALLLTCTVSACRTCTPLAHLPTLVPDAIRVELASVKLVEVMDARMEGDTLVGRLSGEETSVRIPPSQIVSLEEGQMSNGRTFLAVVGIGVLFMGVLAGIVFAPFDRDGHGAREPSGDGNVKVSSSFAPPSLDWHRLDVTGRSIRAVPASLLRWSV